MCVCVCVCDAQFFQIMLKLRGSTMMRRNHEFFCSGALSPGFRNWVEMTRNMQQEGGGLVLLPRPASLVRSPVLPCVEAPLGESVVRTRGAKNPRVLLELMCWEGVEGVEWQLVLHVLPVSAELMTIRKHWFDEGWWSPTLAFGRVPQLLRSRLLP